jgi:hypothetical protein
MTYVGAPSIDRALASCGKLKTFMMLAIAFLLFFPTVSNHVQLAFDPTTLTRFAPSAQFTLQHSVKLLCERNSRRAL